MPDRPAFPREELAALFSATKITLGGHQLVKAVQRTRQDDRPGDKQYRDGIRFQKHFCEEHV